MSGPAADGERKVLPDGMIEVTSDLITALQKQLAPVFAQQREEWEREGPAAMAAFLATGATLDTIGGNCPVQAEGWVDGACFYFRARGNHWEFHVAANEQAIFNDDLFYVDREYGVWPDAGWMPQHEALGFIVEAIGEWRALVVKGLSIAVEALVAPTGGAPK